MSDEKWADIKGYEGYYQISSRGRVKTLEREVRSSRGGGTHVRKERIRTITGHDEEHPYPSVTLVVNGKKRGFLIHRLVAQAFLNDWDDSKEVNHIDFNKDNNAVENLEMVTRDKNISHYLMGKHAYRGWKRVSCKKTGRVYYTARIHAMGTNVSLGCYHSKEDAVGAFVEAHLEFYGVMPRVKKPFQYMGAQ